MKKIYLVLALTAFVSFTFAQTKVGGILDLHKSTKKIEVKILQSIKTVDDTLMYFDGSGFYVNNADNAAFNFVNEDLDGLITANSMDGDWNFYYSLDSADFLGYDIDSAFFMGATSWFNPVGQADNWFSFGPITLPANTGSFVSWAVKNNPGYRDGYNVFISSTGMSNYTDFTNPAIYTRTDASPSTTEATDTVWKYMTAAIPASFNGDKIYVGFQHNANDMDVLYLDEMTVIADTSAGIYERNLNGIILSQNQPNPAKENTLIPYEIPNNANVSLEVFDLTGRLLLSYDQGKQAAGKHVVAVATENLMKGTYFYTLKVDNIKVTKKMVVTQ